MENTKELWDGIWSSESKSLQEHIFDMEKGKKGTVWKGIYKIIKEHFDNINQLHVVELSAGCGYMSARGSIRVQDMTTGDMKTTLTKIFHDARATIHAHK